MFSLYIGNFSNHVSECSSLQILVNECVFVCVHAYYRKYLWDPCETVVPRTTVASRVQQVVTKTWHFLCITGAQHDGFQPSGMQTAISLHVIFVTIIIYIWQINSVLWCLF